MRCANLGAPPASDAAHIRCAQRTLKAPCPSWLHKFDRFATFFDTEGKAHARAPHVSSQNPRSDRVPLTTTRPYPCKTGKSVRGAGGAGHKEDHQAQRKGAAEATPLIRSCSKSSHIVQRSRGITAPNATAPSYSAEAFTPIVRLSTVKMPTIKMMPTARQIRKFCTKPAITKQTNDTPATVRAYGSCVLT